MSTALVIPTTINGAMKPKPTRAEIIDAMLQLKLDKFKKERLEEASLRDELRTQIDNRLSSLLPKMLPKLAMTVDYGRQKSVRRDDEWVKVEGVESVSVSFYLNEIPADVVKLLLRYYQACRESQWNWDEKKMRQAITESLSCATSRKERVQALLDSPESKKAMEALMQQAGI